ncbi:unnamed protein product [Mucor hiemalis]
MTGEKAYHSGCFQCVACKKTIDDLIFTQTTKGIYCTTCHDLRKAEKARRKLNKQNLSDQIQQQQQRPINSISPALSAPALPSPARSRSNSFKNIGGLTIEGTSKQNESFMSDFSPFTLSFFDNDSSDLANLSNSLGANITLDTSSSKPMNSTQNRINRVSEILQSSLRTSSLKQTEYSNDNELHTLDDTKLKQELSETRSRLKELETNYNTLQDANQQALNEFNKVKEDYAKEAAIQQKQELVIVSLLKKNAGGASARKEIERAAQLKIDLERTCKDLIHYRDKIMASIGKLGEKHEMSTYFSSHQKSLAIQIKSLTYERDLLESQTKELKATRDEVVHEMVLLNTKNAELTTMNNDLSRRAIEHEESVPTIHRHTPPPLSPSQSTETFSPPPRPRRPSDASSIMCKVSSRNSFISDQTPTLFRIKKKGSTMFNKLSGGSSTAPAKPNKPEPSLSSSSISTYGSGSKSSLYANNNFNSSLQSLHLDVGKTLVKNQSFMDSSASLQLTASHHSGGNGHSFQPMSFIRPVKCGACGDKIWGRSEYRCDGCGFSSHSRCLSKVPQHCMALSHSNAELTPSDSASTFNLPFISLDKPLPPSKKSVSENSMFGSDLSERVAIENQNIPIIVQECIKAVESRGLDYEGIYRKSGGAAQIRSIQLSFDQGEKIDLCDEEEYNDVCAITSVLKQYFRELPNPLLTFEMYSTFIDISSMNPDEKKTEAFIAALAQLPRAHLSTIKLLFEHLGRVHERSEENRMTIKNLAMVFAPTLMRHSDPSRDFLDISYKNATIEYILAHTSKLFAL